MAENLAKEATLEGHLSEDIIAYFASFFECLLLSDKELGKEDAKNLKSLFEVEEEEISIEEGANYIYR